MDSDDKQRTRHIDNDLIVRTNGTDLFKASEEYRGQLIHATNGITLTQFKFNQIGKYTVSVIIGGLNFFPIRPLEVDFTATVTETPSDGVLHVGLSPHK